MTLLHEPARHEALTDTPWDAARARTTLQRIVHGLAAAKPPGGWWPMHPRDVEAGDDPAQPATPLYHGAAGVVWALRHWRALGLIDALPPIDLDDLRARNRAWLRATGHVRDDGAWLMGDLPLAMMAWEDAPSPATVDAVAALVDGSLDHPARELMWGSPGALLAACFLHERSGDERWAARVRRIAARLEAQLEWSVEHGCHFWTQELWGGRWAGLDAVHGFVATAHGLIRARHLLEAEDGARWQSRIVQTVSRTATRVDGRATWRTDLHESATQPHKRLMQFCHGSPGFVICLADLPTRELDELLVEAGEATWAAGPLAKGSNLCHGTAGNGWAFLKLHARTGDERWRARAQAFAMHAIGQFEAETAATGMLRASLWTGDAGLACYLYACLNAPPGGDTAFPTLDVFFAPRR